MGTGGGSGQLVAEERRSPGGGGGGGGGGGSGDAFKEPCTDNSREALVTGLLWVTDFYQDVGEGKGKDVCRAGFCSLS